MSQCLSDMGIPSKSLYGVTPVETADDEFESQMETREFIVREFNSDNSSFNVIIANPSAVAESISLHKKCHNAIYLERSLTQLISSNLKIEFIDMGCLKIQSLHITI